MKLDQVICFNASGKLFMLELLDEDLSLLVISTITRGHLSDVHLKIVHLPLKVLKHQFLPVIFMFQSIKIRLNIIKIIISCDLVLFDYLILNEYI